MPSFTCFGGVFVDSARLTHRRTRAVAPESAVKFAAYERFKSFICKDPAHPHPAYVPISSCCLEAALSHTASLHNCPQLLSIVSMAANFTRYQGMHTDRYARVPSPSFQTNRERCAAGALAGLCAQSTVYPLEMVKTRLMTSPPGDSAVPHVFLSRRSAGLLTGWSAEYPLPQEMRDALPTWWSEIACVQLARR